MVIINLLTKVVDEVLEDKIKTKERIGEIMGGKVLQLASDDILMKGRKEERRSNLDKLTRNLMKREGLSKKEAKEKAEALLS